MELESRIGPFTVIVNSWLEKCQRRISSSAIKSHYKQPWLLVWRKLSFHFYFKIEIFSIMVFSKRQLIWEWWGVNISSTEKTRKQKSSWPTMEPPLSVGIQSPSRKHFQFFSSTNTKTRLTQSEIIFVNWKVNTNSMLNLNFSRFPYECSLPLPVQSMDMTKVLKDNSQDLGVFNVEKPQLQREYLMKMTATTKHRWFPRLGIKYAKKTKRDREFL